MDVSAIRQGMIFYVDDCTADEKITFNNERFPMKRRPWVVVSNNKNNAVSPNITMCPIYTRSETKLPTQVYFKNGERDQIICCESITTIPKSMIDINKGYIGTVSTYIWDRIHKALMIQLSDTDFITKEKTDNVVDDIILEASRRIDIKNILVDKICDILTKGLNSTETNNNNTENDIVKTQMVIMDTSVENLNGCIYNITPDTIFCDTIYENLNNCNKEKESDLVNESKSDDEIKVDDEIKTNEVDDKIKVEDNAIKNKTGRAKGNKALPITMCKEFCDDCTHMTIDELNNKYHDYMFIKDRDALLNKRWKTAQRLKKYGMNI